MRPVFIYLVVASMLIMTEAASAQVTFAEQSQKQMALAGNANKQSILTNLSAGELPGNQNPVLETAAKANSNQLIQRPLPQKPATAVIAAGSDPRHIEVKFLDDLDIAIGIGGYPVDRTGVMLKSPQASSIFSGIQALGGAWSRECGISEAKMDTLRMNAQQNLGRALADMNNYFILTLPQGADSKTIMDQLNSLPEIEIAHAIPLPAPPPVCSVGNYQPSQGYEDPATAGIDAEYAWSIGDSGANVTICDLEYSWNLYHEDLPGGIPVWVPSGYTANDPYSDDNHGTAVLGEMASLNNLWGTRGAAYGATFAVAPTNFNPPIGYSVLAALTIAMANLDPGDVILIEQQISGPNYDPLYPGNNQFGLVPVEWWPSWYQAIVTAVGNGIHVVEAAGNGQQNLDDVIYSTGNYGNWPFIPQNRSGAIIVGAGAPPAYPGTPDRARLWFSNYGSRLDLQGWGYWVMTTGYNDYYPTPNWNCRYTDVFGGTSSASPIVASAVALSESFYEAVTGSPVSPGVMRNRLVDTGSSQQTGSDGILPAQNNIGPRPNLRALLGGCSYTIGDANNSGAWTGQDVNYSVRFFKGGPVPPYSCECTPDHIWYVAGDVNGSCSFTGQDVTRMVLHFKTGVPAIVCDDCPPAGMLLAPPAPRVLPTPAVQPVLRPTMKAKGIIKASD